MLPPRILFSMEATKVELEKTGLTALAKDMDIWTRPFVAPKEEGVGALSFARIILKPKARQVNWATNITRMIPDQTIARACGRI